MKRAWMAAALALTLPLAAEQHSGEPSTVELYVAPKNVDEMPVIMTPGAESENLPETISETLTTEPGAGVTPVILTAGVPSARPVNDPLLQSYGSWGQDFRDQWGLYALNLVRLDRGMLAAEYSDAMPQEPEPIVVAIIDTGIDYRHPDLPQSQLWRNPTEKANGRDDDGNGLIDDLIGWNFINDSKTPWDDHGHGTHVAGIIAAGANNNIGIAGVAPNARLMVLKALDSSGHGSGSDIARAIRYAVDKGARIIHLSLGGEQPGAVEIDALNFALRRETLVVTAAGNQASGDNNGYESLPEVLVVGALDPQGQRAAFSNWGPSLDLLAPGVEILSLRAQGSDFLRRNGRDDYIAGAAVVDADYYRATGNSFAAPYVTGVAALLLGRDPWLDPNHLTNLLTQSATDLGPPGADANHGYGALNFAKAMVSDPQRFIEARLAGAELQPDRTLTLQGTADANLFGSAYLEYGQGEAPQSWQPLGPLIPQPQLNTALHRFDPQDLPAGLVTVRLTVQHQDGGQQSSRLQLQIPQSRP
ncbi:MAG: S8 family peptidase [Motiliproteus sp.]